MSPRKIVTINDLIVSLDFAESLLDGIEVILQRAKQLDLYSYSKSYPDAINLIFIIERNIKSTRNSLFFYRESFRSGYLQKSDILLYYQKLEVMHKKLLDLRSALRSCFDGI